MTYGEARLWLDKHAAEIAVRVQINGVWGSFYLNELPPEVLAGELERLADRLVRGRPVYRAVTP